LRGWIEPVTVGLGIVLGAQRERVGSRELALVYGTTGGEMSLAGIASHAGQAGNNPLFIIGMFLILVALLFKVAGVPFHMWLPDAYQGAPTPVTGFMAAGIKAAAFGGMLRLLTSAFAHPNVALGHAGWARILGLVAVASMTLGNLAAIRQENIKRMLAYSTIAQMGYLLIGPVVGSQLGVAAVLFYSLVYALMTIGAFGMVILLQHGTVLLDLDPEKMFSLLKVPAEKLKGRLIDDVKARVTSLRGLLGREVPFAEAASALRLGFAAAWGAELEEAELSKADRRRLVQTVKQLDVPVSGTMGFRKAELTAGGVALEEVDSRTMQS